MTRTRSRALFITKLAAAQPIETAELERLMGGSKKTKSQGKPLPKREEPLPQSETAAPDPPQANR